MSSVIRGASCSIANRIKSIIFFNIGDIILLNDKAKWCLDVGETCVYGACILWYDLRSIIESTIPAEPLLVKSEDFLSLKSSTSSGFLLRGVYFSPEQRKLLAVENYISYLLENTRNISKNMVQVCDLRYKIHYYS